MREVFFDFDGVLVDSNEIKRDAILTVSKFFFGIHGLRRSKAIMASEELWTRYTLFQKLESECERKVAFSSLGFVIDKFEKITYQKILEAKRADYSALEQFCANNQCWILTAAPELTVRRLVKDFGWNPLFTDKILGAPKSKSAHLREKLSGGLAEKILIGDSRSDYTVALELGLSFIFISGWSNWEPTSSERATFRGEFKDIELALLNIQ